MNIDNINMQDRPETVVISDEPEELRTIQIESFPYKLRFGSCSHIGNRPDQQDSFATDDDYFYFENHRAMATVCDGMGGLSGGLMASSLCAATVKEEFHKFGGDAVSMPDFLRSLAVKVDRDVFSLKNENGAPLMAGTTLVSVYVLENQLFWLSVGDSHIYIVRGNQMVTANSDHNYFRILKERAARGEITLQEAESDPKKEALVSYIGMGGLKLLDVNYKPFILQSGDRIVLCSDGLYRTLDEEEIKIIIQDNFDDPQEASEDLVNSAIRVQKPHQDNTTAVVLAFD